ncbi:group II intron reverse transcriptase/maturase [Citrobacter freundii]|uniref:group II intron reverse transcriptase/maturase n=1 Tax=Citrobacter freundii TaxID=546 RepID=UPI00383A0114
MEIPKPTGGTRELGIPTVTDRLIQQALLQVLQPLIDPTFSEFSYGFRPGRSTHDAVLQAQRYAQDGFRVVVDVDLEKFFDRVNHDILMDRLARRIADKAVLRLIRRYLQAGIMADGVVMARDEGTPQGGPLSPLLANVLLDEVDRALQQRGHRFARYADDCNVYVRSQKAGERVLRWMRKMYEQLHLRVNEKKTEVGPVFGRKFLGYCLRRWSGNTVKIAVAPKALDTFKRRIRLITRRVGGQGMTQIAEQMRIYLRGWKSYFRLAQTPKIFKDLDSWIRHCMFSSSSAANDIFPTPIDRIIAPLTINLFTFFIAQPFLEGNYFRNIFTMKARGVIHDFILILKNSVAVRFSLFSSGR